MTNSTTIPDADELPPLPPLPISLDEIRKSHGFSDTSHWVIPNVLMQGGRPGFGIGPDITLLDQVRTIVKDGGCRTFVCAQAECVPEESSILLDDDGGCRKPNPKDLPLYANHVISVMDEIGEEGISPAPVFLYYGIIGMKTAKSIDSLSNAVSDLADRIRSGETMYIHCGGGVGRAGLLCACLLGTLYKDLTADKAMEYTTRFCYLRNFRKDCDVHYSSPETEDQKEQVREFFKKIRTF